MTLTITLCIASVLFGDADPQLHLNQEIKQGTLVEPTHGPCVVLADGGLLVAWPVGISGPAEVGPAEVEGEKDPGSERCLRLDSELFGSIELPTDNVAGILFHPPPGIKARDQAIAKILGISQANHSQNQNHNQTSSHTRRLTDDRVTLVNSDQLDGPLLEIKGRRITVETAFGRTDIKTDRVASIVFGSAASSVYGSKEQDEEKPSDYDFNCRKCEQPIGCQCTCSVSHESNCLRNACAN